MKATTINQAWAQARCLIGDVTLDTFSSTNAGYKIWRGRNHYDYVCDLGDRLEVNMADGKTVNIWIVSEQTTREDELKKKVQEQELEIMKLKAQLYDLLVK